VREPDTLVAAAREDAEVLGASPFIAGPVLVDFAGRISTPFIRGIDPEQDATVTDLGKYVTKGEFLLVGEGAVVGDRYAERNGIQVGDRLTVFSPRNVEQMKAVQGGGELAQKSAYFPSELVVTGIFSTGMFDYDSNFVLVSLETAGSFYNLEDGVHGIALKVREPLRAAEVQKRLNEKLDPPLRAYTWMDLNHQLFSAIAVERHVMFFLLLFIVLVAAFGLTSTLITITVQKSREIGLMKALGATDGQILGVFLAHGLVVGLVGSALGLASGLALLEYRNEVSQGLARGLGIEIFPYEIYHFASIPAVVDPRDLWIICTTAVVICVAAAFFPAWSASRLQPAQSLRYE